MYLDICDKVVPFKPGSNIAAGVVLHFSRACDMERSCFPVNVPCCIGITVYILFAAAVSARKVAENTEALVQAMNVVGSNFHIALKARYGVLPVSELSFGNTLISVAVNTVYHIAAVVFLKS